MDYLKFNCYDLAEQNAELHGVYSKIEALADELAGIFNSLDPQIKSYEGLQSRFTAMTAENADVVLRILTAYNALDQIIDVYYAAENKVKDTMAELPVETYKETGRFAAGAPELRTSSISSGELILEDWLAELLYK
ncbi:MAG TPA: hypothetical protein VN381_13290 [Anaerovoracaceae bacterium]|nr:hypothetical protein [Anaerovoracaceae bacterium]